MMNGVIIEDGLLRSLDRGRQRELFIEPNNIKDLENIRRLLFANGVKQVIIHLGAITSKNVQEIGIQATIDRRIVIQIDSKGITCWVKETPS